MRARRLVRRLRPRAVLSVGGYAAGPATLAAALLGVPARGARAEQRASGFANRFLAPFARRAYVAWDEAGASFRASAVARSTACRCAPASRRARTSRSDATVRVLVHGREPGRRARSTSACPRRSRRLALEGRAVDVLHQAGRDRDAAVRAAYERAGVDARAASWPSSTTWRSAIADADLVVARAGAGTIAEITAIGRASVLVPFPHAADDHQARNAEALERAGGAVCVRQTGADPAGLAAEIGRLLATISARRAMADRARARGRPDAARRVARDLLALAAIDERSPGRAPAPARNGGPS